MAKEKVVLAYSGGLDTSVIAHWLMHEKGYEVVAFESDIGQEEDLKAAEEKAHNMGIEKVYIVDAVQDFVEQFVFPALQANAVYEGFYLLGTSLARPLIARDQLKIVEKVKADAIAHGATGKGNDQVRFELTAYALMPRIKIISPWKMGEFIERFSGRGALLDYAIKHNIPVEAKKGKNFSTDRNIMHSSHEGEILENPWERPPLEEILERTVTKQNAPDKVTSLHIHFKEGIPVMVHNVGTGYKVRGSVKIVKYLNKIGGQNGVGVVDTTESRRVGMKSRGVYETPGVSILHPAHRRMENLTLDGAEILEKDALMPRIAKKIYDGDWYSPEMEAMMAFVQTTQKHVNGVVGVELYKGNVDCFKAKSPNSLYNADMVSFEGEKGGYNQEDAAGYIRVTGTRLRTLGNVRDTIMGEKVHK